MTISTEKEAEIRRLLVAESWPPGAIARHIGVHHDVVARVARALDPEIHKPRSLVPRPRMIDPYIPFIQETLAQYPSLGAARVHDMICERGFTGSMRRTRALLQELRPRAPRPVYRHVEVLPGEQSQIDWGHLGRFMVDGATRDVWFFVMVLSWSRALWAELVLELSTASLLRSLVRASTYFGGMTRQWLFDNAKAVVVDRSEVGVRFNSELLELASQLHVMPKVCTPRRANEKGRVERAVRFLRERHFAARSFAGLERGNRELAHFIDTIALDRAHVEEKSKTVRELLELERERLLPLPETMPSTSHPTAATVDAYGYVRFETNEYAAPGLDQGRGVQLWVDDRTLKIADGENVVGEYPRWYGKRRRLGAEKLDRVGAALRGDRRANSGRQRLVSASPVILSLLDAWVDEGRNMGSQVARALKLLELYGSSAFAWAVEEQARRGGTDLGGLEQLCEVRRREGQGRIVTDLRLGSHVPDKDVSMPSLEAYDE